MGKLNTSMLKQCVEDLESLQTIAARYNLILEAATDDLASAGQDGAGAPVASKAIPADIYRAGSASESALVELNIENLVLLRYKLLEFINGLVCIAVSTETMLTVLIDRVGDERDPQEAAARHELGKFRNIFKGIKINLFAESVHCRSIKVPQAKTNILMFNPKLKKN
ncbi:hypothetical protein BW687_001945 [Pseudomonas graminis]|uniref:hypothetical protein n=1 Tax=Pseudomonas graminis TaxID=158627 RepID=UPI002349E5C1|nr:hypothetical protein [Pseudomonas graminis]MDC6378935.1 hypothetical protein [Pseudomonas graminis]